MNSLKQQDELEGIVRELRALPTETEWAEFKANNTEPQMIGERISAISNMAALRGKICGYLLWGISNHDHALVGTSFEPNKAKTGNEDLQLWLSRMLTPRLYFKFHEGMIENKHIVLLEIPRAHNTPTQFSGVEYIRVGSCQQKLKDNPEIERELWRVLDSTPFEKRLALHRADADRALDLLDYPAYFSLLSLPLPENKSGILKVFADDGLLAAQPSGKFAITNLGAILFARDLNQFESLDRKVIRLIRYKGVDRLETLREYPGRKGYATGFAGLIDFIGNLLPENEVLGKALRKSVPMYPPVAIRELIANALIHQDFSAHGCGPMIEVFSDRVEITNPGDPLIQTERFLDSPPRSRNEILASLMRRMGICEERGSGVDKVVFQTELYQLPAPIFEKVSGFTRSVLFAHKPLKRMDKADRCRACYLHACLRYVSQNPMTNSSLRERFGIEEKNSATVSRIIKDAMDSGLVRPYDVGQSRKYAKYLPFWA
ncbi:MAG TPA: ATP-binding protein [Kiritimatiellia bacterium]|nr:ATP-binding protein [Kiritimatiellia bacterium]